MLTVGQRQGKKWTVTELISLQREYELLEMSIEDIADKHKRSTNAIIYKLKEEGLWTNDLIINGSIEYEETENIVDNADATTSSVQELKLPDKIEKPVEKQCITDCDMVECLLM